MKQVYIIKIPTKLDKKVLGPVIAEDENYAVCKESESMYGGFYPLSYEVVCYFVPKPRGFVIVPYKSKRADTQYGFYEFNSKKEMRNWFMKHKKLAKPFIKSHPELFI